MNIGKKRILIVDDEKETVKIVTDLLKAEGYTIIKAYSGQECLEKLKRTDVDLVLLDFFMPGMSGREVLEKIRNDPKLKNLKVAFMTIATFSQAGHQQIENMGVADYIKKPFNQKELIKSVYEILKRKPNNSIA